MRFVSRGLGREFARMRDRSTRRDVVKMTMLNLDDRAARRSLLAWSLLDWFHYAGYRYLASAGAAIARNLVFEPLVPAPNGLWFERAGFGLPLASPEPVVLARISGETTSLLDAEEIVAIGTQRGSGVCVLPFANDTDGRSWERVAQLGERDRLATLRAFPLRRMTSQVLPGGLHADMRISDAERGIDVAITSALGKDDGDALCGGTHPFRKAPPHDTTALESGTRYTFDVVSDGSVP